MTRQDAVSNLASLAKSWGIGTVLLCVAAYWVSKKADYLTEVGIPAHLKQIQQLRIADRRGSVTLPAPLRCFPVGR